MRIANLDYTLATPHLSGSFMRIHDLKIHSIAMADPPLRSSYGLHAPYALRTVIELRSEDGITGIAETHGGDVIARGRERYRNCPYRNRDDAAEMRKHVDTNWQRVLPRW